MQVVAFDCETHRIQPGLLAPPLVCASVAQSGSAMLLNKQKAREVFREILVSDWVIAGAAIAYDMAVMVADAEREGADHRGLRHLVFDKYRRGQVHDVLVCQALDAIYTGTIGKDPRGGGPLRDPATGEVKERYSLSICCDLVLGRKTAKKNDFWRERYALLDAVPMSQWPFEACQYPVDDAVNTLEVAEAQLGLRPWYDGEVRQAKNLEGLTREVRADLALHLGAVWGLRTHKAWLDTLSDKVEELHDLYQESFADFFKVGHKPGCGKKSKGCVSGCSDGKEDGPKIRRLIAFAYGASGVCPACAGTGRREGAKGNLVGCSPRNFPGDVTCDGTGLDVRPEVMPALPRTDGGGVKADRDTLIESGDERLMAYGEDEFEKIRTTYVPFLRKGVDTPLNLSPNVLVSSFRTSYYGPIQQMPREGEARTSFVARPGYVLASCDYSGIELCTLAQVCLWTVNYSRMAEIINETGDPGGLHAAFGAQMLGCDPAEFKKRVKAGDKAAKDFRQAAKAANFGFPGGMGAAKLALAKRKKNEGKTVAPDGTVYTGIRFCILLGGAERCGVEKVTEWKGRPTPPVCKACCYQAEILRNRWLETFPEMPRYFDYVNRVVNGVQQVLLPFPGSVRGGVGFTDCANGHFQELAAILGKTALWDVVVECYDDPSSVLYDTTRAPFFVHDEIFAETLFDAAHLTAPRIGTIMERAGVDVVPDVKVKVEPAISRRWLKAMEPAFSAGGLLIPWEDSESGRKYLAEKGWTL